MKEARIRLTLSPTRFAEIHPQLRCRVEWVDALDLEPSGKLKKVSSKIGPPRAAKALTQ